MEEVHIKLNRKFKQSTQSMNLTCRIIQLKHERNCGKKFNNTTNTTHNNNTYKYTNILDVF